MVTHDDAQRAIMTYYEDVAKMDAAAMAAHFEPDGTLADPVGTTYHEGLEAIKAFLDARLAELTGVEITAPWSVVCGDRAAACWRARVTGMNGIATSLQGVTVFTFGAGTKFRAVEEYYHAASFVGPIVSA